MQNDTVRFWIGWTLATLVGYVVGIFILLPFAVSLAYAARWPFLIGLLSGAVLGATTGFAQWLLLRRRTPITIGWVGASITGGMLGMALGMSFQSANDVVPTVREAVRDTTREATALLIPWRVAWEASLAGALFGLGVGICQWWTLRQYARGAGTWIYANSFGWMVGLGLGAALAPLISTIGALILTGLLAAAITARSMERWQWEMRKRSGPIPGRRPLY